MILSTNVDNPQSSHTIQEFITSGRQNPDNIGHNNLSYIEKRNNIEYEVKIILDDYQEELMSVAKDIKLSDKSINEYKFNPKKLSNALYGTPRYWHVILRINGLASVHDFSLSKKTVKLLEPNDMKNIIGQIYSTEKKSIIAYNNAHDNMIIETPVNKYVYVKDASKKFDTL